MTSPRPPHDGLEQDLGGALHRRADRLDDLHPIDLDAVRGRARGIRRRRTAAAGLAAAAVVAVAVPVGLTVGGAPSSAPAPDVAAPTQTVEPLPGARELTLTTDVPEGGGAPGVAQGEPGRILLPDGAGELSVEGRPYDVAPFGDRWVILRSADDKGYDAVVEVLDAEGRPTAEYPASSFRLDVSADATVVSWGAPGNRLMVLGSAEDEPTELYRDDTGPLAPVEVIGSQTCDPDSAGGGCAVYATETNTPRVVSVTSKGIVGGVPELIWLDSVADDGRFAGVTGYRDDIRACSAVLDPAGERLWRTCDWKDLTFSPDGRYVSGVNSTSDGAGSSEVVILDAATGELLARAGNDERTQAFSPQQVWDTDGSLLMTVAQQGSWRLVRLTPRGELLAVPGGSYESSDPYVSDRVLSSWTPPAG